MFHILAVFRLIYKFRALKMVHLFAVRFFEKKDNLRLISIFVQVPVLRVYGATQNGQKACIHIHRVYPYLCIPVNEIPGGTILLIFDYSFLY